MVKVPEALNEYAGPGGSCQLRSFTAGLLGVVLSLGRLLGAVADWLGVAGCSTCAVCPTSGSTSRLASGSVLATRGALATSTSRSSWPQTTTAGAWIWLSACHGDRLPTLR